MGPSPSAAVKWVSDHLRLGIQPWEELNATLIKAAIAEFWVTTLLLFITIGTICNGCKISDFGAEATSYGTDGKLVCPWTNARVVQVAAAFGFTIAILVYVAASFSGGHINPAITLAFAITRQISLLRAALYFVAQVAGAILGSVLVYLASIWLLEFMLTSVLVFVVFAATDNERGETAAHLPILAPFAIGFTVFVAHLCAIPLDGCSINPARSIGPAVISGYWQYQWIFWVGPLSGGVFGGLVYGLVFRPGTHLIIPGTGLEAGTEEAKREALPEYAGVQGVEEADGPSVHSAHSAGAQPETQGGWSTGMGIKLPAFSGAGGLQKETE